MVLHLSSILPEGTCLSLHEVEKSIYIQLKPLKSGHYGGTGYEAVPISEEVPKATLSDKTIFDWHVNNY